jgi:hypothetical protein
LGDLVPGPAGFVAGFAFLFLASAILSFLVVRTPLWRRRHPVAVGMG